MTLRPTLKWSNLRKVLGDAALIFLLGMALIGFVRAISGIGAFC